MKVIIVDDERNARESLENQMKQTPQITGIAMFASPYEAIDYVNKNTVDVAFLDIEMPGMDGIELASRILDIQAETAIVFVTAYNQYAVEAFKLNALDYLMKPATADRLKKTLTKIIKEKGMSSLFGGAQIKCFGRFAVKNKTDIVVFRTEKAEELLAFIIDRISGFISRSEIIDSLWENFEGDRALINFNTTLHYLKKALLQYGVRISFTFDRGGYKFDMSGIDCDYLNFCTFLEKSKMPVQENILEFEQAAGLFTGEYLSGGEYDWASIKRMLLTEQYLGLTLRLAEYYKEAENFHKAGEWLKAGLLKEPLHRELNYRLMETLILTNEHALAAKYFDIYKNGIKKKLGQEPDREIQKLFQ